MINSSILTHLFILISYAISDHLLPQHVSYISALLNQNVSNSQVVHLVLDKFGISVKYEQVAFLRTNIINTLLKEMENSGASPSSFGRLKQLFLNEDSVSYVYVTYDHYNGFVATTKSSARSQGMNQDLNNRDIVKNIFPMNKDDTEFWMEANKVSANQEVICAFAWSHNEEARKLSMFPEFLAVDLSFGGSMERNPLFVCCGIDGENKAFTGKLYYLFKCLDIFTRLMLI